MSGFSASDAALEGFQVIRRHWRLVVGWAGFNVMALVAMVVVAFIGIILSVALVGMGGGGREGAALAGQVIGSLVGGLGTLAIEVAVVAALFRLLLRDTETPGFFHLRLGRDEVRLLAVWLTVLAMLVALVFGVAGLTALGRKAGTAAAVLVAVGGVGGAVWLLTRVCLAAPLSFAERRFGVAAAWRLSRGRFWALLGMNLLALCLLALVALLAWLALYMAQVALSGFHDFGLLSLSDTEALKEHPLKYLLQLVAQLAFAPVLWVISQAPLAAAYKALSEGP